MSGESNEVRLARHDEQLKVIVDALAELKSVGTTVHDLVIQVASLDKRLTEQAPTIDEFITIKHKVVGAGLLGKWIWAFGAFILGVIASGRTGILGHLTGAK